MAQPKRGYHKLAILMASESDAAIFRRFSKLNYLTLLALQAELLTLEAEYDSQWATDEQATNTERAKFAVDFKALRASKLCVKPDPEKPGTEQWKLLMDIRAKLNTYNEILLQVAQVHALKEPEKSKLDFLQSWLVMKDMGAGQIEGREGLAWDDPSDLLALASVAPDTAPFSNWATGRFLTFFHYVWGYKHNSHSREINPEAGPDLAHYEETVLVKYTRYVITILASLLPIVCIVILWAVHSVGWRLGIMAIFTAAFASILVVFTSAKEVEIFASTAAFAAVEVVFIGSALAGNSTGG
ncbi:hypothetical protein DL98DRAFT_513322 [Cadophora sp. DSE1049]|nr:hypothetical protein DL98DRAFT_513322 [Cadophora sp. DSE1049]